MSDALGAPAYPCKATHAVIATKLTRHTSMIAPKGCLWSCTTSRPHASTNSALRFLNGFIVALAKSYDDSIMLVATKFDASFFLFAKPRARLATITTVGQVVKYAVPGQFFPGADL